MSLQLQSHASLLDGDDLGDQKGKKLKNCIQLDSKQQRIDPTNRKARVSVRVRCQGPTVSFKDTCLPFVTCRQLTLIVPILLTMLKKTSDK